MPYVHVAPPREAVITLTGATLALGTTPNNARVQLVCENESKQR